MLIKRYENNPILTKADIPYPVGDGNVFYSALKQTEGNTNLDIYRVKIMIEFLLVT